MVSHGFYASLQVYSVLCTELLLMPTLSFRMSSFPSLIYSSPEAGNEPALQADVSDWKSRLCNSSFHVIPTTQLCVLECPETHRECAQNLRCASNQ